MFFTLVSNMIKLSVQKMLDKKSGANIIGHFGKDGLLAVCSSTYITYEKHKRGHKKRKLF